ncbi:OLC1v1037906C1 [Oldenlandia corymbosa var. corymbosa]|uniref:OLC1v1037906C1 n=1 Tax=Oldenlandia corymbosa var. corymbosa TaxID=529605 RepID=A0AAV1D1P8_OLDCO|nr:OLC1v1037906C1 [Oldenlandia corymbosa var. corymbosa]
MKIMTFLNRLKPKKFRGIFNGVCAVVFLVLLSYNGDNIQSPLYELSRLKLPYEGLLGGSHDRGLVSHFGVEVEVNRRKIQEDVTISSNHSLVDKGSLENHWDTNRKAVICSGLYNHTGYATKCDYLRANPQCNSGGFFNYIKFFYCDCQSFAALGYIVLAIWLVTLFYLLGNTAADYFCSSLEKLSNLLNFPPTVAGVTLLPLGNGAPDVFASIAAFVGRDSGEVGLNSVLGGAVFVVCVVVGTVSLFVAEQNVRIDKKCFIRDVCFFLFALLALFVILLVGEVSVASAIAFVSIYVVYALCVAANEIVRKCTWGFKLDSVPPLLPVKEKKLPVSNGEENESLQAPLLDSDSANGLPHLQEKVPHWMWSQNVSIYSNEVVKISGTDDPKLLWGWNEDENFDDQSSSSCSKFCSILELPLMLPRRLTIPIVDEERWSKGYAVGSASLAPLLLALLWDTQDISLLAKGIVLLVGAFVSSVLGVLAFVYTSSDHPPQRFLLPWVLGGFFMSIIWFYIVANELVALLVAFGIMFGVKPSLLALTILAWGNSMGDLMSNVAMAMNGGDGIQIAISGCYAGPMFNTLAGLGISLLLGAWNSRPAPYVVPKDSTLYSTLGFVTLGLVWCLVVLPWKNMHPTKLLGLGLMTIYLIFLSFRATFALSDTSLNL